MAGSTGERPLRDIVTDIEFWKLHIVNFPAIFLSGWLFVSSGLAYDVFGTPRPDQYFAQSQPEAQIVTDRFESKQQLERLSSPQIQRGMQNDQ